MVPPGRGGCKGGASPGGEWPAPGAPDGGRTRTRRRRQLGRARGPNEGPRSIPRPESPRPPAAALAQTARRSDQQPSSGRWLAPGSGILHPVRALRMGEVRRGAAVQPPAAEEIGHQANLSTQEALSEEGARVSRPDVLPRGCPRAQAAAPQGTLAPDSRTGAVKRRYRLRRTADYQAVRAERRGAGDPLLRVQVRPRSDGSPRVGMAVSRRLGGAVTRNLLRRRLRAAARARISALKPFDVVIIPSPTAARAPYAELAAALDRVLARAGAL